MKLLKRFFNKRGLSLAEVMIGLLITMLSASAIIYLATSSHSMVAKSHNIGDCRSRAQTVLALFKDNENKMYSSNWHPWVSGALKVVPNVSIYRSGVQPVVAVVPSSSSTINANQTNSWSLVDASYNWAVALYSQDPTGWCSGSTLGKLVYKANPYAVPSPFGAPGVLKIPDDSMNYTEEIYMKIERVEFRNNHAGRMSVDCPPLPWQLIPESTINTNGQAVQLTVTVRYDAAMGTQATPGPSPLANEIRQCQEVVILRPPSITVSPAGFKTVVGSSVNPRPSGPGECGNPYGPRYCYCEPHPPFVSWLSPAPTDNAMCITNPCTPNALGCTAFGRSGVAVATNPDGLDTVCAWDNGRTTANIDLSILSGEAASTLLCALSFQANVAAPSIALSNNWYSCGRFNAAGTPYFEAASIAAAGETTGVRIQGQNMPKGTYALRVKSVSAGQVESTPILMKFQVSDPCPSSWTDQYCPAPFPSIKDRCNNAGVCQGTMPLQCPAPATALCSDPIFDRCARPCPPGSAFNSAQCAANTPSIACGQMGVTDSCNNGGCTNVGSGLNSAQCTANQSKYACGATVYDDCGNTCSVTGTGNGGSCVGNPLSTPCGGCVLNSCGSCCDTPGQALLCTGTEVKAATYSGCCDSGSSCIGGCVDTPLTSPPFFCADNTGICPQPPSPPPSPPVSPPPCNPMPCAVSPPPPAKKVWPVCPIPPMLPAQCTVNGYSCVATGINNVMDPVSCNTGAALAAGNSTGCSVYECTQNLTPSGAPVSPLPPTCTGGLGASSCNGTTYSYCTIGSDGQERWYQSPADTSAFGNCPGGTPFTTLSPNPSIAFP